MDFMITGLCAEPYRHLFGLPDEELLAHGARRYIADESPGFPDRIEMRDAEIGEALLLVNHVSVAQDTPYRASHAIFILEGAVEAWQSRNTIPAVMTRRLLSLRAFDADGMIVDAQLAQGERDQCDAINQLLALRGVDHIDAHFALRGCFSGRIVRG